jgi:excisionase family DNA binding protein
MTQIHIGGSMELAGQQMLLSAAEAAQALGVSESSLRRRTKEGTIQAIRIGRRVLYSRQALTSWIQTGVAA